MIALSWAITVTAVVLAAAGVVKLLDPAPTARMVQAVGLRAGDGAARLIGAGEVVVGVAVVVSGLAVAVAAMAAWYAAFTVTLAVLRVRSPDTPCGCIGRWSGPPARRHLVVNAAAAVCAVAGVATATAPGPPMTASAAVTAWFWAAVLAGSLAMVAVLAGGARQGAAVTR